MEIMRPPKVRAVEPPKKKYHHQAQRDLDWTEWWSRVNLYWVFGIELMICLTLTIPLLYIQFTIEFYHLESYLKCIRGFYFLFMLIPNILLIFRIDSECEYKSNRYMIIARALTNLLCSLIFTLIFMPFKIPATEMELSNGQCQAKWIFRDSRKSLGTDEDSYASERIYIYRIVQCVLSNTKEVLELLSKTRFVLFLAQYLWTLYFENCKKQFIRAFSKNN